MINPIVWILLLVVVSLTLVMVSIIAYNWYQTAKRLEKSHSDLIISNGNLEENKEKYQRELSNLKEKYITQERDLLQEQDKNLELNNHYMEVWRLWKAQDDKLTQSSTTVNELNKKLLQMQNDKNKLELALKELNDAAAFQGSVDDLLQQVSDLQQRRSEIETATKGAEGKLQELFASVDKMTTAKKTIEKELERLEKTYGVASKGGRGDRIVWMLSDGEKKVVELVEQLVAVAPELSVELRKILWSKVWMPKFQKELKRRGLDGKGGIYLLESLENNELKYVGQAMSFKERWYTHAKKMLGVEGKGNEWVYELGGPDKFSWEVLEEGTENMDERERYWIEYWGTLNKR